MHGDVIILISISIKMSRLVKNLVANNMRRLYGILSGEIKAGDIPRSRLDRTIVTEIVQAELFKTDDDALRLGSGLGILKNHSSPYFYQTSSKVRSISGKSSVVEF